MVIDRKNRRVARRARVAAVVGQRRVEAALDTLESMELARHDCFGESSPPEDVIDDVLTVSEGNLDMLSTAALLGVMDWRDPRVAAQRLRS